MHQSQLQNNPITPLQEGFFYSQAHSDIPTEALPPVPFHQCSLSPCCLLLILAIFVCFVALIVELVESIVSLCLYLCFFWAEPDSTEDEYDEYDESNDDSHSELCELSDRSECFGCSESEYDDSYTDSEADYSEDECSIDSDSENNHSEYSETEMDSYEDFIEDKMSIDTSNSNVSVSENVSEDTPIICSYCCEPLKEDEEPIQPCDCKMYSCHECIRTFFRLAIHDEMSMPPRCCRPIPLAIGRMALSPPEVDLYKEKHDEWSTANRCYCPLPTCSAFLPPRLFPELSASQRPHADVLEEEDLNMEPDPWNTGPPPRPIINCPKCTVAICVKCVQIVHAKRDCARDDGMTPELTNELERIGSKRCPKCRAAVRKTYGCRHMRCRCGAQWCWYCYLSVLDCENNGCTGEESEASNGDGYLSDEEVGDVDDGDLEDIIEHDDEELPVSDEDSGYDYSPDETEWTGGLTWNDIEYLSDEDDYNEDEDVPIARDIDDFNAEWKIDGAAENHAEPEPEAEFESELEESGSEAEVDDRPNQEPEMGGVVPFDCTHKWRPLEDSEVDTSLEYECEHCWCHIYPSMTPISELQSSIDADDEIQPSMTVFDLLNDNIMLQCSTCCMILCNACYWRKF